VHCADKMVATSNWYALRWRSAQCASGCAASKALAKRRARADNSALVSRAMRQRA
jgi:hypothetical protein